MQKKRVLSGGFTLIEIMISILVLAVIAVGILRLYVAAQVNHQKAVDLDYAVLKSNALLEELRGLESLSESKFTIYYNKSWSLQSENNQSQYAIYGDIKALPDNKRLFTIELRVLRLLPYPLEKVSEKEVYKLSSIIENQSYWSDAYAE